MTEITAKICMAINLAQDHEWPIPMASLLPQALTPNIKISAQLHVIEAKERHEKSPKKATPQARCGSLGGLLI